MVGIRLGGIGPGGMRQAGMARKGEAGGMRPGGMKTVRRRPGKMRRVMSTGRMMLAGVRPMGWCRAEQNFAG